MGKESIEYPYGQRKVGVCDGSKIASLKCKTFASLTPVRWGGETRWLCGRCLEKIRLRKKAATGIRRLPTWYVRGGMRPVRRIHTKR